MGFSIKLACSILVAFCALAAVMAQARAEPDVPSKLDDSNAPDPAIQRYLEGERHYAAGRYELAIEEFEAALKLSSKASLHFNIANCHERAGNYAMAAASLEKFLASANPPEPEILRERVWHLKRRAGEVQEKFDRAVETRVQEVRKREKAEEPKANPSPEPPPTLVPASTLDASTSGELPSLLPAHATLVGGGVALATALAFGALSKSAGSDAEDNCLQQYCSRAAQDALDRERRFAIAADVTGAIGLAAIAVGGVLWYRTDKARDQMRLQVTPLSGPGTAGVSVGASF